ncbi:Histone deacetylase hda1 [Apophysomyces sp. BC1034]|nr:Histone deacetylase hda1 [Apophysomyces sp. BC1021]KAG0185243.1 Histone deacetylase hda1 [Apophysomyces sp. BC1034]
MDNIEVDSEEEDIKIERDVNQKKPTCDQVDRKEPAPPSMSLSGPSIPATLPSQIISFENADMADSADDESNSTTENQYTHIRDEVDELASSNSEYGDTIDIGLLIDEPSENTKNSPASSQAETLNANEVEDNANSTDMAPQTCNSKGTNDRTTEAETSDATTSDDKETLEKTVVEVGATVVAGQNDNLDVQMSPYDSDRESNNCLPSAKEISNENPMDTEDDGTLSSAPQSFCDDMDVIMSEPGPASCDDQSHTATVPKISETPKDASKLAEINSTGIMTKHSQDTSHKVELESEDGAFLRNYDVLYPQTKSRKHRRRFLKTGYVYDVIMSFHANLNDEFEKHPEDPRRIYSIYRNIEKNGITQECQRLPIVKADQRHILRVHTLEHLKNMRATKDMSRENLLEAEENYESIYLNSHSYESSLYSAGGVIEACKAVVRDKVANAFAIVRPPGHHAYSDAAMGFCLMNNVAIATRYCMAEESVERVLIVDWDIHFGNGTQQIFSEDPNVLYISLHRFEGGTFYPEDRKGSAEYVGYGKGEGKTVNIPWPCTGMTDADYIYAFQQIVIPVAREFQPSLVIVSAGFDAALGDPIGESLVTPDGYGQMTYLLKGLANGRLVLALEGGYNLNSISVSALACMSVLVGESPEPIKDPVPRRECIQTVSLVKRIQSRYWETLKSP